MDEGKRPPFAEDLVKADLGQPSPHLSFANNPDWVVTPMVRPQGVHSYQGINFEQYLSTEDQQTKEGAFEKFSEYKRYFQELEEFGIAVPEYRFVVGHDDQRRKNVFQVRKKVEGMELGLGNRRMSIVAVGRSGTILDRMISPDFVDNATDQEIDQLKDLLLGILRYYRDKISSKETALSDVTRPEQFIYGKVAGDPKGEKKYYLVDLDPYLVDFSKDWFSNTKNMIHALYSWVQSFADFAPSELSAEVWDEYLKLAEAVRSNVKDTNQASLGLDSSKHYKYDQNFVTNAAEKSRNTDLEVRGKSNFYITQLKEFIHELETYSFEGLEDPKAEVEMFAGIIWLIRKKLGNFDRSLDYRVNLYLGFFHIEEPQNEGLVPFPNIRCKPNLPTYNEIVEETVREAGDLNQRLIAFFKAKITKPS